MSNFDYAGLWPRHPAGNVAIRGRPQLPVGRPGVQDQQRSEANEWESRRSTARGGCGT